MTKEFTVDTLIYAEEIDTIDKFFDEYDSTVETVKPDVAEKQTAVSKYISSLTTSLYAKSVEDIANTHVGNKLKRKRNFQQIMQQSFFYGANRFGNNFIA